MVKSTRSTIYYYTGDEAFYAAIDTYLVGATWISQWSMENNTGATQTYSHQHTTQLKITSGMEVTKSVNIGAEFKGLSIGMNSSTKTFTNYETTTSQTKTLTINIPPRSKVTFYQRRYDFKVTMVFILDAWNQEWMAHFAGDRGFITKECTVQIMSENYLATDTDLCRSTVGMVEVDAVIRPKYEELTKMRERENLTKRAKRVLHKMGI